MILQGDRTQGQEAINKGLSMVRDEEMYLGDYGSAIRDKAMMLYQLLINNQTVPELGKQVKALADLIHGRSYLSTQEQVFVFLLGRQLEKQATQRWRAQLLLNQQTMDLSHSGSYMQNLQAADLEQGIGLVSQYDAPLYLSLDVQGYPEQTPPLRDKPISIKRQWFTLAGQESTAGCGKAG
ncbi:MAG: hypothetical protein R3E89_00935 [Thiolinea sp.]